MTRSLIRGSSLELQSGGPPEDPLWKEAVVYLCVALTFFVLLFGGVAVTRWLS